MVEEHEVKYEYLPRPWSDLRWIRRGDEIFYVTEDAPEPVRSSMDLTEWGTAVSSGRMVPLKGVNR